MSLLKQSRLRHHDSKHKEQRRKHICFDYTIKKTWSVLHAYNNEICCQEYTLFTTNTTTKRVLLIYTGCNICQCCSYCWYCCYVVSLIVVVMLITQSGVCKILGPRPSCNFPALSPRCDPISFCVWRCRGGLLSTSSSMASTRVFFMGRHMGDEVRDEAYLRKTTCIFWWLMYVCIYVCMYGWWMEMVMANVRMADTCMYVCMNEWWHYGVYMMADGGWMSDGW